MRRDTNTYTILFALMIAALFSLLLSVISQSLDSRQRIQLEADIKFNILMATGLRECPRDPRELQKIKGQKECVDIQCCYDEFIETMVVDHEGNPVDRGTLEKAPFRIDLEKQKKRPASERILPVFKRVENGKVIAYCVPVVGKGLWSTIKGYVALKPDMNTIFGIAFYSQGETPGLGAEIQTRWFQDQFKGKKIRNMEGNLVSVKVKKGKVQPDEKNREHKVDGISGATLTGNGVTDLLQTSLEIYEPYFQKVRKGG